MTLDDILKSRGFPSLLASDFEVKKLPDDLTQISFFGVTKEKNPAKATLRDIRPGSVLVFTDDGQFYNDVKWHFRTFDTDDYSGSTMYSSLSSFGSTFEVITVGSNSRGTVRFKGRINIVYIEVGTKGQVIRLPTKRRAANDPKK